MRRLIAPALIALLLAPSLMHAQRYSGADGRLRVALVKQPFSPTGTSAEPNTMANGGIQQVLTGLDLGLGLGSGVQKCNSGVYPRRVFI